MMWKKRWGHSSFIKSSEQALQEEHSIQKRQKKQSRSSHQQFWLVVVVKCSSSSQIVAVLLFSFLKMYLQNPQWQSSALVVWGVPSPQDTSTPQ